MTTVWYNRYMHEKMCEKFIEEHPETCDEVDPESDGSSEFDFIVGDWIAFTGATDRQKAFARVINSDYLFWWLMKPEDERNEEFSKSFRKRW